MGKRFDQGWQRLKEIHQQGGEAVIASYQDLIPDLSRYIIEFAYGDIYSRPGLDLPQRQLLTIVCLLSQGGVDTELRVHLNTALNVGLSPETVLEALLHCIPYVGFPKVMEAVNIAREVFAERESAD